MNKFKSNIDHLSAKKLDDYVHEQLSNDQMHEVEKHLLGCNLCSDALEGVREVDNFLATSEKIKRRLVQNTSNQKRKNLFWIAAGVSIVLVSGIIMYLPQIENGVSPISMKEDIEESESLSREDVEKPEKPVESEIILSDERIENKKELKFEVVVPKAKAPVVAKKKKTLKPQNTEEMASGKGMVAENADVKENIEIVVEPLNENFAADVAVELPESDIALDMAMSSQRVQQKRARTSVPVPQAIAAQTVEEERTFPNFEDSVFIELNNAVPTVSRVEYQIYLRENVVRTDIESRGDVIVSFFVDKNTNIVDLRIEKGLNSINDKEAQRLILDGPAWKLLKDQKSIENNKVVLKITFN